MNEESIGIVERDVTYGSFRLGRCEFAVPACNIQQVVELPNSFQQMAQAPPCLKGTFNLRGLIIPVIDLGILFSIERVPNQKGTVAVIEYRDRFIGILFDRTGDVFQAGIGERSDFDSETRNAFVRGIFKLRNGQRLVQVLDLEGLFGIPNVPKDNSCSGATRTNSKATGRSRQQYLEYRVDGTRCALPISVVQEVLKIDAVTQSVLTGGACLGITELRGGTVPIIDFSALLGGRQTVLDTEESDEQKSVIVMRRDSDLFGLLVDSVDSLIPYYEDEIVRFPSTELAKSSLFTGCISTDENTDVIVLNHDALLEYDEIDNLTRVHGKLFPSALSLRGTTAEKKSRSVQKYLTFSAGKAYAIQIEEVQEIVDLPSNLLRPPGLDPCFSGVHNLRDSVVVAVVDFREVFSTSKPQRSVGPRRVLIFDANGGKAGFIVDSVDSIITVDSADRITMPRCPNPSTPFEKLVTESLRISCEASKESFVPLVRLGDALDLAIGRIDSPIDPAVASPSSEINQIASCSSQWEFESVSPVGT